MGKKALRRRIATLEHDLGMAESGQEKEYALRLELHSRLFDAGLLLVEGPRTQVDRVRAAQTGVLVLADVEVLPASQYSVTQNAIADARYLDPRLTALPGRLEAHLTLELVGDPAIIEALAEHVRSHR